MVRRPPALQSHRRCFSSRSSLLAEIGPPVVIRRKRGYTSEGGSVYPRENRKSRAASLLCWTLGHCARSLAPDCKRVWIFGGWCAWATACEFCFQFALVRNIWCWQRWRKHIGSQVRFLRTGDKPRVTARQRPVQIFTIPPVLPLPLVQLVLCKTAYLAARG